MYAVILYTLTNI